MYLVGGRADARGEVELVGERASGGPSVAPSSQGSQPPGSPASTDATHTGSSQTDRRAGASSGEQHDATQPSTGQAAAAPEVGASRAAGARRRPAPPVGSYWRHVARGGVYRVAGTATCRTNGPTDGTRLVVYTDVGGDLHARELGEFMDGRFLMVAS